MAAELLLIRITALFAGALIVGFLWRKSPRRVHQMWTLVFAASLALPLAAVAVPTLEIPVTTKWIQVSAAAVPVDTPEREATETSRPAPMSMSSTAVAPTAALTTDRSATSTRWPELRTLILGGWSIGSVIAVAFLIQSVWRARRLVRSSTELSDAIWTRDAAAIGRALGAGRDVRLIISNRIETPMAGEVWRPTVLLPEGAAWWPADVRRAVLGHEMTHLVRHDPRRLLITRLMLALYWFHPLAWIAAWLDRQACEDACDDTVIGELGMRPSTYANVLLDCAPATRRVRMAAVGLPMAHRGSLERRLLRILRPASAARQARIPAPALVCAALALFAGVAQPVARVQSLTTSATALVLAPPPVLNLPAPTPGSEPMSGPAQRSIPSPIQEGPNRPDVIGCRPAIASPTVARIFDAPRPAGMNIVISEARVGRGYSRRIARDFEGLSVCLLAEDVPSAEMQSPTELLAAAGHAVLEARYGTARQRLEIAKTADGWAPRAFIVNGVARPIDDGVREWQGGMLDVLELTWDLTQQRDSRTEAERRGVLDRLLRAVQRIGTGEVSLSRAESACDRTSPPLIPRGSGLGRSTQPRYLRETFGDLDLCVRIDEGNVFESARPGELIDRAGYAVLEARRAGVTHQFALARDASGTQRSAWRVNGLDRPVDAAATAWRQALMDVLDTSWQMFALRGEEGLLNGDIAEVHGRVSTDEIDPEAAEGFIKALRARLEALDVDVRIAEWTRQRDRQVAQFRVAMSAVR